MKNWVALLAGGLMMLAAAFLAAGTSSQDTAPRPQFAQVMATSFHARPSATPHPTFTPIPTATPLRITHLEPNTQEILNFLFQYPYWGAYIIPSPSNLSLQSLDLDGSSPTLIITGNGAEATDGLQAYPAAFGAVLSWDEDSYTRKFLRVQFGHQDTRVSVSITPDGRIVFTFRDIRDGAHGAGVISEQTVVLNSCHPAPRLAMVWGLDRRWQTKIQFECF